MGLVAGSSAEADKSIALLSATAKENGRDYQVYRF